MVDSTEKRKAFSTNDSNASGAEASVFGTGEKREKAGTLRDSERQKLKENS